MTGVHIHLGSGDCGDKENDLSTIMQEKIKLANYQHEKEGTEFQMNLFGEQNDLLVTG